MDRVKQLQTGKHLLDYEEEEEFFPHFKPMNSQQIEKDHENFYIHSIVRNLPNERSIINTSQNVSVLAASLAAGKELRSTWSKHSQEKLKAGSSDMSKPKEASEEYQKVFKKFIGSKLSKNEDTTIYPTYSLGNGLTLEYSPKYKQMRFSKFNQNNAGDISEFSLSFSPNALPILMLVIMKYCGEVSKTPYRLARNTVVKLYEKSESADEAENDTDDYEHDEDCSQTMQTDEAVVTPKRIRKKVPVKLMKQKSKSMKNLDVAEGPTY